MSSKPPEFSTAKIEELDPEKSKAVAYLIQSLGYGVWKWDMQSNALDWDSNMYKTVRRQKKRISAVPNDAWESSLSPESESQGDRRG